MLERQGHSRVIPRAKSSGKTERRERKWTTFLDPGPPKSGRCTWRRHFVGVPAAVMGYLQSLAARDAERFAYPSISTIARKAVPGRNLDRGYIGEVLEQFKNRLWVEPKRLERNGRERRGWIVRTHDAWLVTKSAGGVDLIPTKCGLSPQDVLTKSTSGTSENRSQPLEKKEDSSDGVVAEPVTEPTTEPAKLAKDARALLDGIGFEGEIKSPKLLNEIGKLAQGRWTLKKDGKIIETFGIEKATSRQLARLCARWRDRCNHKKRKLPVELLYAINRFEDDANVLDPSEMLPKDW